MLDVKVRDVDEKEDGDGKELLQDAYDGLLSAMHQESGFILNRSI